MADRHVHWADDEAAGEDDDNASFVPPSPYQSTSNATSADDDDSLVDSPSPPTPLWALAPAASTVDPYQSCRRARGIPVSVQVPVNSFPDARIRSPGETSRFEESPTRSNPYRMTEMGRALPTFSPPGPSPRKSSAPGPPRHSRRGSTSSSELHPLFRYSPSASSPALVWNVGDKPSDSTVHMLSNDNKTLEPIPFSILNEPATRPPQREIRIHCVGHSLWKPIPLRASDQQSPQPIHNRGSGRGTSSQSRAQAPAIDAEYITVKDVISAIYYYLHTRMTAAEYDALEAVPTPGLRKSVARSFHERCEAEERSVLAQQRVSPDRRVNLRSPIAPSSERSGSNVGAGSVRMGGLRRLDCLLGQTRFLGLTCVASGSGDWYMNVSAPPL